MDTGMLWLDDDKRRTFSEKVQRAAAYYERKYGQMATFCFVNETMIEDELAINEIKVQSASHILPHHFWIGSEQPIQ